ncbi:MAG TPA: ABC transporter permease [Bryobacteraceae bacterium]|nr:ABC transporter permease [Bryobacteraceae bacterium]
MSHSSNQPVAVGLRLYRALARAFPYEFKNAYGDELVQVTEEAIEPIWRRHGLIGLVRLLVDVAIRIPLEYLAEFRQDVTYGLRVLAASPGFTAVALISLTLGIGVATSAFSEMNGFILRDVPAIQNPDGLVLMKSSMGWPDYERYRDRTDLFSSTMAYVAPVLLGVSTGGQTERTWGHLVTASYFPTLRVSPWLGRFFAADEEKPGYPPTAVVSYRLWQGRLGSDPSIIGKALRVNGQSCTIVGVGPENFQGASPMMYNADIWLPLGLAGSLSIPEFPEHAFERHDQTLFHLTARLRPGISEARAEAELDAVARQLEREYGDPNPDRPGLRAQLHPGGKLIPLRKEDLPFFTGFFTILGGMILLIASSNVANMMMARAADRRKEIAVRLAIGAGRARLVRQLLTESLLLAVAAGVLGLLMATWIMHLASRETIVFYVPVTFTLGPDHRVLLFTVGLTAFTGLAFGLLPALQATRPDLSVALKEGGNVNLRRFGRLSLRNLLVLSQVAGSLTLLLITGFLVIGHRRIMGGDPGFDPQNLYVIGLDPIRDGYSGQRASDFFKKLLDRVKGLPSVASASLADAIPMQAVGKPGAQFQVPQADGSKVFHWGQRYVVGRDYFATIGIPIVRGRGFRESDETKDSAVIVISEKMARDCWKGEDPIGRHIELGGNDAPGFVFGGPSRTAGVPKIAGKARVYEVVGVARNIRTGLDLVPDDAPGALYVPMRPEDSARPSLLGVTLVVRAKPGADVIGAVQREISTIDDKLRPFSAHSMPEQIRDLLFPVKVALYTYGFIGVFGLILASVGLAGVTAYSVSQRRREIGIRMALGARAGAVLGLVMKEGAVLVGAGTIAGLLAARAGIRVMSAALAQIARTAGTSVSDPMLLLGAPLLLAALALAACYLPARRSMRIDPVVALRQE